MSNPPASPRAAARPSSRSHHGVDATDPYSWLIDPDDPEVVPHLEAENAWTAAATAGQEGLRTAIFDEIRKRTRETDLSVPVRDGKWWYLVRTREGLSYPIHCRRPDDGTGERWVEDEDREQVLLDPNQLAGEGEYLGLGVLDVSPDGNWLAYAIDRDGDERHDLRFRDLRPLADGADAVESAESVSDVAYGFAWAADSATCWYTVQDDASRPHRVLRHRVGDDPGTDVEVFREDDERFHVGVGSSRSGAIAVISTGSAVTSESWLLDCHDPERTPEVVTKREQGIEYSIAHHSSGLFVTSNHGGAVDFALWRAPLTGTTTADRDAWEVVVPHSPGTRIDGVEAFADHLVMHGRTDAVTAVWLLDPVTGAATRLEGDEEVGTFSGSANPEYVTSRYRYSYQSLTTPASLYELDLVSGERTLLKQQPVLDGFDASLYSSERRWADAADGTRIPISLVWRSDRCDPADPSSPSPCLLYGYGAYEASMDPWFSIARLSLLDRGMVFAIAHVRGGGELGRGWYEDGKFGAKSNSFTDFVACARHLIEDGVTSPDRLAARGGSAGGLLMGAVVNLAPELFRVVVAEVPFVDPLNTILDPSLPLTVVEWEEWGDPLHDPEAYGWLAAYSPYENIRPASEATYPAILATAGLHDPRVGFHEPTKWVAALRDSGHGSDPGRPVLLKVELGAGHGGPTGRYDAWRDEAFVLAFLVDQVGAA